MLKWVCGKFWRRGEVSLRKGETLQHFFLLPRFLLYERATSLSGILTSTEQAGGRIRRDRVGGPLKVSRIRWDGAGRAGPWTSPGSKLLGLIFRFIFSLPFLVE